MLLECLIFFCLNFQLLLEILNMLVRLCLTELSQNIAMQLLSSTAVFVQHGGAQKILVLTILDQRVYLCPEVLQLVLYRRQARSLEQISNQPH